MSVQVDKYRVTFWNRKTSRVEHTVVSGYSALHAARVAPFPAVTKNPGDYLFDVWIPTKVEKEVISWCVELVNVDPSLCSPVNNLA